MEPKLSRRKGLYERGFKRLLDVFCAFAAILLFSWLYVFVGALVRLNLGKPIIFKQQRPGLDGKVFNLYKFRTMTNATDSSGKLLSEDERATKFGRFLRSTSLDELPELFNVLKGNMSLVGPRPLMTRYLPYYTENESRRHEVLPGLTGWAQVNGRNAVAWDKRLQLDVWYVDHCSLSLDLKIIVLTILKVVKREGADTVATKCGSFVDFAIEREHLANLDSLKKA